MKELSGNINLPKPNAKGSGDARRNFALNHLRSAASMNAMCKLIEPNITKATFAEGRTMVFSFVTGSIMMSVASIEANINELFCDAVDGFKIINGMNRDQIKFVWELIEESRTLDKYDMFLKLNGLSCLDRGIKEVQYVSTLIKVRNALIHSKPGWESSSDTFDKISDNLRGKFELSTLYDVSARIYPHRCMTYHFSTWAINSCMSFYELFSRISQTENRFGLHNDSIENPKLYLEGLHIP